MRLENVSIALHCKHHITWMMCNEIEKLTRLNIDLFYLERHNSPDFHMLTSRDFASSV
jgi:hypothetical protein